MRDFLTNSFRQVRSFSLLLFLCVNIGWGMSNFYFRANTGPIRDNHVPSARQNIGLSGYLSFDAPGFPGFYNLSIRELYFKRQGGMTYGPIQQEAGFERLGDLVHRTYSSSTVEWEEFTQKYRLTNPWHPSDTKEFYLTVRVFYYPKGVYGADSEEFPLARINTQVYWPEGIPAHFMYESVTNVGHWLRADWGPYSGYANGSFQLAQGDYLRITGALPSLDPGKWGNTVHKALARLYDVTWRSLTQPAADIYWIRGAYERDYDCVVGPYEGSVDGTVEPFYHFNAELGAVLNYQEKVTDACPALLPKYTEPDKGMDQVAFFMTMPQYQSQSSYSYYSSNLYLHRKDGMRSVYLKWFYDDPAYGDVHRKVNRSGVNNSVVDALAGLMYYSEDHMDGGLLVESQQRSLTCPGGICTKSELVDLEYQTNPDVNYDLKRLNSAVYILDENQSHIDDPPNGHIGGIVYGGESRAFVFPKGCPTVDDGYLTIGHEVGHTFGMAHQWSQCDKYDDWDGNCPQWNCENGTLMSYSTNGLMAYHDDAAHWFAEAPFHWVSPRWGFGTLNSETLEPNDIITWENW